MFVVTDDTDWCVCVVLRTLIGGWVLLLRTLTGVCLLLLRTLTGVHVGTEDTGVHVVTEDTD